VADGRLARGHRSHAGARWSVRRAPCLSGGRRAREGKAESATLSYSAEGPGFGRALFVHDTERAPVSQRAAVT